MPNLFKFIAGTGAIRSLLSGTVKFTPIRELNDPAELKPALNRDAVQESLQRLREAGYTDEDVGHLRRQGALMQRLAPRWQAVEVPSTREAATRMIQARFYESIDVLEKMLTCTADEMASQVGLFCLSKRFDSMPMWAHYAANASGCAVEFAGLDEVFPGDETGVLRMPRSVSYETDLAGVTFDPRSHDSIFFSKFDDWSYEQEVRVVLPLKDCRVHEVAGRRLFLFEVPRTCIRRVILGWNMSPDAIASIRSAVRELNSSVEIVAASFDKGRIRLCESAGVS